MKYMKIGFVLLFIMLVLGTWIFFKNSSLNQFTKEEKTWIRSLSKEDKNYFLSQTDLHSILKNEEFKSSNFSKYISFFKQNGSLTSSQIIKIVNLDLQDKKIEFTNPFLKILEEKEFLKNNLDRYIAYQKENNTLSIKQVVSLVNQDIDMITMNYTDEIGQFIKEPYFIKENLKRYMDYQKLEKTDPKTTVSYVNSNLDYPYYTNTIKADLTKGLFIIVNKYYALTSDYVPEHLINIETKYGVSGQMNQTAYEAFKKMFEEAQKSNLTLYIQSPYRSYQKQNSLYQRYCNQDGKALADTYSARPGYSEHQTGLAIDIVNGAGKSLASFEGTKEFDWMKKNAYQFGFVLRYPKEKEKITGYQYEPWHYRYVGTKVAKEIYESNLTFEEYYAYYLK